MKDNQNIEEALKGALEGFAPAPPPRVKRRILATIIATIGFSGGSTLFAATTLIIAGTLVAGITAAVIFMDKNETNTGNPRAAIENAQTHDRNHTHRKDTPSDEELETGDNFDSATESVSTGPDDTASGAQTAGSAQAASMDATVSTFDTTTHNPPQAAQAQKAKSKTNATASANSTTSDEAAGLVADSNTEMKSKKSSRKAARNNPEGTGTSQNMASTGNKAAENINTIEASPNQEWTMSSLPAGEIPFIRQPSALRDPEDFYMPKSPRQHSRWSLQTQLVAGQAKGLLSVDKNGISRQERDPLNTRGIQGMLHFHASPRWSLGGGISHRSVRAEVISSFEEATQVSETVIIDGEETTVVSTVLNPRKEQESLRFSYMAFPVAVYRSIFLTERLSIDAGLGAEVWILNFSKGKLRMTPDRKLDLSIPENANAVLNKSPMFLSAGAALNYRVFHRFNLQTGVGSLTLINQKPATGQRTYPTGYLFHAGFGYRF